MHEMIFFLYLCDHKSPRLQKLYRVTHPIHIGFIIRNRKD